MKKIILCLVLTIFTAGTALARPPVFATPDQAEFIRGARSLQDGFERDAFDKFLRAASWGNKQAQKVIGTMYAEGLSVDENWARAHAWYRLAASHGDQSIITDRDAIWESLRDDEKEEAEAYYQELVPKYGDLEALRNRERWVRRQKREVTGSRLGNVGALRVQIPDATGYQWELSGQEYFSVLDAYIEELRAHLGEVELGDMELVDGG